MITGSVTAIPRIVGDEGAQAGIDGAAGGPVELHPGGRVDEDHATCAAAVSAGMSPMAWAPLIARASSRLIG